MANNINLMQQECHTKAKQWELKLAMPACFAWTHLPFRYQDPTGRTWPSERVWTWPPKCSEMRTRTATRHPQNFSITEGSCLLPSATRSVPTPSAKESEQVERRLTTARHLCVCQFQVCNRPLDEIIHSAKPLQPCTLHLLWVMRESHSAENGLETPALLHIQLLMPTRRTPQSGPQTASFPNEFIYRGLMYTITSSPSVPPQHLTPLRALMAFIAWSLTAAEASAWMPRLLSARL